MRPELKRSDLLHPELSYSIVGCAFEVFNELGSGHYEKVYQKAMALSFQEKKLNFKEQVYYPVNFKTRTISKGFLDFEVENKVVVELKRSGFFSKNHIDQVLNYLVLTKLQLAILISFPTNGVTFKRIINVNESNPHNPHQ